MTDLPASRSSARRDEFFIHCAIWGVAIVVDIVLQGIALIAGWSVYGVFTWVFFLSLALDYSRPSRLPVLSQRVTESPLVRKRHVSPLERRSLGMWIVLSALWALLFLSFTIETEFLVVAWLIGRSLLREIFYRMDLPS